MCVFRTKHRHKIEALFIYLLFIYCFSKVNSFTLSRFSIGGSHVSDRSHTSKDQSEKKSY